MFGHTMIPLRKFPRLFPIVSSLILVQTVFFISVLFTGHMSDPHTWVQYGAIDHLRIDQGEYWRFLISLFLHVNFFQFIFIVFAQYILAPQLEWLFGKLHFLLIFLLTGLIGNIGIILFEVDGIQTGASSAIYGLLGVYLYLYARRLMDVMTGRALLILTVINLLFNFSLLFPHLLALLAGFLLAAMIIMMKQLNQSDED
ncbi:rhomboid family intramembrane serine protease [Hazenella coriacea]|uniref:Membrane associated rhomboid family serine protease n=1 Tax=Hazenella coriacea TaxID=1179467 RepID=A0A4R3L5G7_9BACL|nr:rhomboid family intramembrane serine protease [Hazenella coriacea]TCS94933.1 membrane associated rhomboid family serine protease [Hazenella coriacea]